jgi:coenzyme F420-dependent glucose-6-phosphate dehydrogenase
MSDIYWFLADEQFQPEELVNHAVAAEKAGFDGVMVSEHLQPWVDDSGTSGFTFSVLGAIAVMTNKIKIITGVTTPLFRYHPAIVAQASATIDRLSSGRFELGIGTGELLNEGPLGFNFPNYKERSDRIIEAIEIMKPLLNGETVNYKGKYYQVDGLKLYSPSISHVPIYMAAGGPKSAITATKYCDGIITSVKSVDETITNIINPSLKIVDKKTRIYASRWSIFAEDNESAWSALSSQRGLRAPSRAITYDPSLLRKEADSLEHNEILSKYSRVESAEDYIKIYSPLITELKADTIIIQTTSINQLETIDLIGRKVLPQLNKL